MFINVELTQEESNLIEQTATQAGRSKRAQFKHLALEMARKIIADHVPAPGTECGCCPSDPDSATDA